MGCPLSCAPSRARNIYKIPILNCKTTGTLYKNPSSEIAVLGPTSGQTLPRQPRPAPRLVGTLVQFLLIDSLTSTYQPHCHPHRHSCRSCRRVGRECVVQGKGSKIRGTCTHLRMYAAGWLVTVRQCGGTGQGLESTGLAPR